MQDGVQSGQQGTPDGQQGQQAPQGSDDLAYWKGVAQRYREKAAAFDQYEPIISHMNENPAHVDDFRRIVSGEAQLIAAAEGMAQDSGKRSRRKTEEDLLAEELGLQGDDEPESPQPRKPKGKAHQVTEEEARRFGAMQERARIEFEQFEKEIQHEGAAEYMLDEFQEWLRNPSGIAFYDLFSAWAVNKRRLSGENAMELIRTLIPKPAQQAAVPEPTNRPPMPVTAIPGARTNKPDGRLFVDSSMVVPNDKWVPNPAEI